MAPAPPNPPSLLRRWWLWLVLPVIVLLAAAAWWLRSTPVPAIAVQQAPLLRTLQVTARVATLSRVELGATLTGRVQKVAVNEGDTVRAGDVLIQLESEELRAAWLQAQANEQQALARVQGLRSTGRVAAQAAVAQARANLVAAQAELQRSRSLVAQGFLSGSRLDELQRTVDVAQAQQRNANAQLQANADDGTDMQQAQAQLAVARAATASAAARLAQTQVRAPGDARVLLRAVEPGQIAQPGTALLNLALAGPTELVAPLDERFLDQLQIGQGASVVADAFADHRMAARVSFIAPGIDAQRGAVEVKLALQDPAPAFLREDMTLSVEIETGHRDAALLLPLAALRAANTVYIFSEGRALTRPVQLGLRNLAAVEITAGLSAGDVVLLGDKPQPGMRVKPQMQAWRVQDAAVPTLRVTGRDGDAGAALTNAVGR